jgi:hypothetical protein
MKISPQDPSRMNGARNAITVPEQQLRWRKELELAQWQQRLRYQPLREGTSTVSEKPSSAAENGLEFRSGDSPLPTPVSSATAKQIPTETLRPGEVQPLARLIAASVAKSLQIPATSVAVIAGAQDNDAPEVQSARPKPSVSVFEPLEWQPVAAYVSVHGNRVSIGLRDPRVADNDALDLYYRLRGQFVALGLELSEFTLNGHPIEPVEGR